MWPTKPTITTLKSLPRRAWRGFLFPTLLRVPFALGVFVLVAVIALPEPFYGTDVLMARYYNEDAEEWGEEPVEIYVENMEDRLIVVGACVLLLASACFWIERNKFEGRDR